VSIFVNNGHLGDYYKQKIKLLLMTLLIIIIIINIKQDVYLFKIFEALKYVLKETQIEK